MVDGWVDGWMEGKQSQVKDCLQQSKRHIVLFIWPHIPPNRKILQFWTFQSIYIYCLYITEDA